MYHTARLMEDTISTPSLDKGTDKEGYSSCQKGPGARGAGVDVDGLRMRSSEMKPCGVLGSLLLVRRLLPR